MDDYTCKWKGSLDRLSNHLLACPFHVRQCPHCKLSYLSKHLDNHKNKCEMKPIKCEKANCGMTYLKKDAIHHENCVCKERRLRCHNGKCRKSLPAYQMEGHDEICQWKKIICPVFGCKSKFIRKQLSTHKEDFKDYHIVILNNKVIKQTRRN